ncbi:MAG: PAS domain S-box protein [Gemmatimonadales bacterium]
MRTIRVLLACGEMEDATLVEELLHQSGGAVYTVERACSLSGVFRRVAEGGGLDVVLLDVALTASEGQDTFSDLLRKTSDLAVILLATADDRELTDRALAAGAKSFLRKDLVDPDRLRRAIEKSIARQGSELELGSGEQRYKTLARLSPVGVFRTDPAGACLYVNERWCEIAGLSPEEALGGGWVKGLHPDDRERIVREWYDAVRENRPFRSEYRFRRGDGVTTWVMGEAVAELGARGEIVGHVGTITDITARKRVEKALRDSESHFRAVFDHAGIGMAVGDLRGRILQCNRAMCAFLGYDSEEIEGLAFEEVTYDGDVAASIPAFRRLAAGEMDRFQLEKRYNRKGGAIVWGRTTVSLVRDAAGDPMCAVAMVEDVTGQKKAEAALRKSEAMLRKAQEIGRIGSWDWDLEKNRVTWSDQTFRLFGVGPSQFSGSIKDALPAIHPEDRSKVLEATRAALHGNRILPIEFRILSAEGERVLWGEGEYIGVDAGRPTRIFGTVQDVTELKRAESVLLTRLRQQAAVTGLGHVALAGAPLAELMNEAVREVSGTLGVGLAEVFELLAEEEALVLRAGVGWREGLEGRARVGVDSDSQAGYTLRSNSPVIVTELATETRFLDRLQLDHRVASGASVVIRGREGPFGVLAAHSAERRVFGADDVQFLEGVANVLAHAIERKRAEEALDISRTRLRKLAGRLQQVREEERTLMAQEIHDHFGQVLTALKMDLAWLKENRCESEEALEERLDSMIELVDSTVESVRAVSTRLRPAILDDLGLEAAVEWQVCEFARHSGMDYSLDVRALDVPLESSRATAIFRILQESLTNVARHAEARHVDISMVVENGSMVMQIRDDGRGITQSSVIGGESLGLIGMRERAASFGGEVDIRALPEGGTVVCLTMPVAD